MPRRPIKKFTLCGGYGLGVPPVPIPNTEVKPQHADGTWLETARESRSLPHFIFLSSSMAEHSAVNRRVVGSSPTWGAKRKQPSLYKLGCFLLAPQVGLEPTTLRLTAECSAIELLRNMKCGSDLLSRAVSSQVPSACWGLTSVFGMGTGGTPRP